MQPLQSHHFPKSPLPKVTLPKVTTLPLSPPPFFITSLRLTPPFINVNSCVMYCYVMSNLTPPFINVSSLWCIVCIVKWCQVAHHHSSMSVLLWCIVMWCQVAHHPSSMSSLTILFVRNTEVLLPNFLWSMDIYIQVKLDRYQTFDRMGISGFVPMALRDSFL